MLEHNNSHQRDSHHVHHDVVELHAGSIGMYVSIKKIDGRVVLSRKATQDRFSGFAWIPRWHFYTTTLLEFNS
jgi:formylmethanofuran dehydrogenase subunit D